MDELFLILIPVGILLALVVGSILGFVAFGRARRLDVTVDALRMRLADLERRIAVAPAAGPAPVEPPPDPVLPPLPEEAEPVDAPSVPVPVPEPVPDPAEVAARAVDAAPDQDRHDRSAAPSAPSRAPARPGIEESIGSRWTVWIGGIALALGGVFLVRFSIEAGLLGPGMRVTAGFLFAALMLAAGEWLRRSGLGETPAALRGAYVPGVVTAAGIVAAFAATYAAYALYGFIGDTAAFVALGAVALATLALALLHGPAIAGLGLVASYATPFLVSSAEPSLFGLAVYVVAVMAATVAVARLRRWRALAIAGVVGTVAWALFMCALSSSPGFDGPVIALFVATGYLIAHLAFVTSVHGDDPGRIAGADDRIAAAVLGSFALPVLAHIGTFGTGPASVALMVSFGAVTMTTVYGSAALRWLVPVAVATLLLGYTAFAVPYAAMIDPVTGFVVEPDVLPPLAAGAPTTRLLGAGFLIGLLFLGLGLLGVAGSVSRAMLAVGGTTVPLGLAVLAYLAVARFGISVPFGFAALALAGFFALTTEQLGRRFPATLPGADGAVAAYAVAAVAALAAGLAMMVERGVLTIALAAIVPALAMVEAARPVKALRPLALVVSAVVAVRLLLDPEVVGPDLGTTPVFNWLLWGYGVPALCFALAAWRFGRVREDRTVHVLEALAVVFVTLTVVLLIHHAMTRGDIYAPVSGLVEQSLVAMTLMAVSLGMQWLAVRRPSPVFSQGTLVAGGLGLLLAGLGLLVAQNPGLTGEPIDRGPFDWRLVLGYLAPAALALALSRLAARRADTPHWYVDLAAGLSGVLVFAFVTLAVRAAWHTGDLRWSLIRGTIAEAELYAYSVAWLLCGVALLALGVAARKPMLRVTAAALVAVVVGKVFLWDTAGLTGALRAASFIGLGAVLVLIGLAYQRVLRRMA